MEQQGPQLPLLVKTPVGKEGGFPTRARAIKGHWAIIPMSMGTDCFELPFLLDLNFL